MNNSYNNYNRFFVILIFKFLVLIIFSFGNMCMIVIFLAYSFVLIKISAEKSFFRFFSSEVSAVS